MRQIFLAVSAALLWSISSSAATFSYFRQIVIRHEKVTNTDQTNFPVYVSITDPSLRSRANGGHVANENGSDLVFFSDNKLTTTLKFELESYNPATGKLVAWVCLPALKAVLDTELYLAYGNEAITSPIAVNPWDDGYIGVYHFGNGTTINPNDSTLNRKDGVAVAASPVNGYLDGGLDLPVGGNNGGRFEPGVTNFDIAQLANSGPNDPINTTRSYTVSFWMKWNGGKGYSATLWAQPYSPGYSCYFVYLDGNTSEIRLYDQYPTDNVTWQGTNYNLTVGWHHMAFTTGLANGQATLVYVDGRLVATIPTKNMHNYAFYGGRKQPMYVGGMPSYWNPDYFTRTNPATFDELEFSTVARSADWISTSYNNQTSPATFYTVGAEQQPAGAQAPTVFPVGINGVTPTQAIFSYRAASDEPCTIAISDSAALDPINGNFRTLINDVNPALFAGSDKDSRPGSMSFGRMRTVVIGRRNVGDALDQKIYSRALQANKTHYYNVSCANKTSVAKGSFTTANIPLGNSGPESLPFNPNGFGNYGWPTIDYSDLTKTYIDPLTGGLLRRWTSAGDENNGVANLSFASADDLNDSWQSIGSINSFPDGNFTTYQGSGGQANALFLWGPVGYYRPTYIPYAFNVADDTRIRLFGYGDAANATDRMMTACLSADHGQSCLGSAVDIILPQGTSAEAVGPDTFPSPVFHAWGDAKVRPDMLTNNFTGTATVSGNTITWASQNALGYTVYFPVTSLQRGDKIMMAGTDPYCPSNLCTVDKITNEKVITINEAVADWSPNFGRLNGAVNAGATSLDVSGANGAPRTIYGQYAFNLEADTVYCNQLTGTTFSGCSGVAFPHAANAVVRSSSYYFPNFGFKVWKKTSIGKVFIDSARHDWATSAKMFTGFQGADPYCSPNTVTANYAADGLTPIDPLVGRICTLNSEWGNGYLYFVAMETGESRKIMNLNGLSLITDGANPTRFYAYDSASFNIRLCMYDVNDPVNGRFKTWNDNYGAMTINPAFSCNQTLTAGAGNDVLSQITRAFPQIDISYFGNPRLTSATSTYFNFAFRSRQDGMAWYCIVDITKPVGQQAVKCRNTWDTYPLRWSGAHGDQVINGGYLQLVAMSALNAPGASSIERWDLRLTKIYNNGGSTSLSSNFFDPQTCEQLGVADPKWVAAGATGRRCVVVNVDNEPLARNAASGDLSRPGSFPLGSKPMAWAKNAASCGGDGSTTNCYSYLQPMQVGDSMQDAAQDFGGEKFVIVKKTQLSDGTFDLVLFRNANPSGCQASSVPSNHGSNWTPIMWPSETCGGALLWNGILDPASSTFSDNPQRTFQDNGIFGGHTVLRFLGSTMMQYSPYVWNFPTEAGGYGAGYGVRKGPFLSTVGQGAQFGVNDLYPFAGSRQSVHLGYIQSHPGGNQYAAPPSEQVWGLDGRPLGGAGGGSQALWYHTFQRISGTANVYKISLPLDGPNGNPISFSGSYDVRLDRKRREVFGFAGFHLLRDISGPASRITDTQNWSFCIADLAGECAAGSAQGDQFVNVPQANTSGLCMQDYQMNTPCLSTVSPAIAAFTQFSVDRADPYGLRWRKLTYMMGGPARTNNYANMHTTSGGEWGVSAVEWGDGIRTDVFGMKLLPWPAEDSITRNTFINVPISVGASPGTSVRVRFGYTPNLFCSSRQEQCSTAVSNADPFTWLSEPQTWQSCDLGVSCQVNVSAIASRVLYYVIDRKDSSGNVVSGPMQVTTVN